MFARLLVCLLASSPAIAACESVPVGLLRDVCEEAVADATVRSPRWIVQRARPLGPRTRLISGGGDQPLCVTFPPHPTARRAQWLLRVALEERPAGATSLMRVGRVICWYRSTP